MRHRHIRPVVGILTVLAALLILTRPPVSAAAVGPPVAVDDVYQVTAGGVFVLAAPGVLSNDSSPSGGTMTATKLSNTSHGGVLLDAGGSLRYNADFGYLGLDSFTYTLADGSGQTAVATVTFSVNANQAPIAADDNYTVANTTMLVVPNPGVTGNDVDPNGDVLTVAVASLPTHGLLYAFESGFGAFNYQPDSGFVGGDSFMYTVGDAHGGGDTATVFIAVTGPSTTSTTTTSTTTTTTSTTTTTTPSTTTTTQPSTTTTTKPTTTTSTTGPSSTTSTTTTTPSSSTTSTTTGPTVPPGPSDTTTTGPQTIPSTPTETQPPEETVPPEEPTTTATVVAGMVSAVPPTSPPAISGSAALPRTGAGLAAGAMLAVLLLVGGGALASFARRRQAG